MGLSITPEIIALFQEKTTPPNIKNHLPAQIFYAASFQTNNFLL